MASRRPSGSVTTLSTTAAPVTDTTPATPAGMLITVSERESPGVTCRLSVAVMAKVMCSGSYPNDCNVPAVATGYTRSRYVARDGLRPRFWAGGVRQSPSYSAQVPGQPLALVPGSQFAFHAQMAEPAMCLSWAAVCSDSNVLSSLLEFPYSPMNSAAPRAVASVSAVS